MLAACTNESYETGNGTYSNLIGDFVVAHATGEKQVDYVLTDDGDSLRITNSFQFNQVQKADTFYRAQLYYNKPEEGKAEAVAFAIVPTLPVYPQERVDTMKTDPVRFESAWISKSGRYLNIGLYIMTGTNDGKTTSQTIATTWLADTLTFYHAQNGAPEYYSTKVYLSVPLANIPKKSFILRINTYNGWVERRFTK